ncbi:leucine carboxyl methyltransferase 1 [Chrysoperla carnea]|uniref:leucine carboxyl methyltransferase 1 n=1 Tax=Chrysoperla carnea TaxID=189513 RepID=UPI001D074FEE|nr:leucine carboxyl methyltransferase 1 [Chrysoperla carnea]
MEDEPIQATNDDASECKRCAVQLGYWQDNYITLFIKPTERRTPEINRGYYARVKGVEMFIEKFLKKAGDQAQIINLGCGFDTLYWRLKDADINVANYVELDFPNVTGRKCYAIKRHKQLLERIHDPDSEIRLSSTDLHAGNYHLIGVDLRNLKEFESKIIQAEINYTLPTLFIAECVLVYIESECVHKLLSWIGTKFQSSVFVNYEMVNLHDIFGNIMLENLKARGCNLAGIDACKNLETQQERFKKAGWDGATAWDMIKIYHALPSTDRHRVEKIEFLDEQEVIVQLFQHYCICVAWNGTEFADLDIT